MKTHLPRGWTSIALLCVALLTAQRGLSQTTLVLQAQADAVVGFHDGYNSANNNYGTANHFSATSQPSASSGGGENTSRSLIVFDLAAIPAGATVTSATLDLYGRGPTGPGAASSIGNTGDNEAWIQRVTSAWNELTVTWNTQPTVTTTNQIDIGPFTQASEDASIDVTQLVWDMLADPTGSFGFRMRLVTESPTRQVGFWSREATDAALRPTLTLTLAYDCNLAAPTVALEVSGDCINTLYTLSVEDTYEAYLWSTGETTQVIESSSAGYYEVTVTDELGCTAVGEIIFLGWPPLPPVVIIGEAEFCSGGFAYLSLIEEFYSYEWSTGETTQGIMVTSGGTYAVTVYESPGACPQYGWFEVTEHTVTLVPYVTDGTCNLPAVAFINASGGTPPYNYLWNNGSGTEGIIVSVSGTYTVTVTDANGCIASESLNLNVAGDLNPEIDAEILGGCSDLMLWLDVGTGYETYLWSTGETTNAVFVPAGYYSVTVTDAQGCSGEDDIAILPVPPIPIYVNAVSNSCDGSISLCAVGPSGSIESYLWSTGETTSCITVNEAGYFDVEVLTVDGCWGMGSIEVTLPVITGSLDVTLYPSNVACDASYGTLTAVATGGVAPYGFAWSNGATGATASVIGVGPHSVTVTDVNGCSGVDTIYLLPAPVMSVDILGSHIVCVGGTTTLYIEDESFWSGIEWSNGATTSSIAVGAGSYSVTTYLDGCPVGFGELLVWSALPVLMDVDITQPMTAAGLGSIEVTVTSGEAPFLFVWSNGATTKDLIDVPVGEYTVTVTDEFGCTATATAVVESVVGPCPAPTNVTVTNITTTSVLVTWDDVGAPTYIVEYQELGTTNWFQLGVGSPSILLTGLTPGATYEVSVASECTSGFVSGFAGPVLFTTMPDVVTGECFATGVVSFTQGKKKNGTAVAQGHSNANNATGMPEGGNNANHYVSLGFGGSFTLSFDHVIYDQPGCDLQIVETTQNNAPCAQNPEMALVEVSLDGNTWVSLGTICQDGCVDIAGTSGVQYIRITDVSNPAHFNAAGSDGYDLDGVYIVGCANGVRLSESSEVSNTISLYPNPAETILRVLMPANEGTATITVYNALGQQVMLLNATGVQTLLNVSELAAGVYLLRVESGNNTESIRFTKQ